MELCLAVSISANTNHAGNRWRGWVHEQILWLPKRGGDRRKILKISKE